MVAPNPAALTRKYHFLSGLAALSRTHFSTNISSRVPAHNPTYINSSFASCRGSRISLLTTNGRRVFTPPPPQFGFGNLGLRSLRVSGHGGSGGRAGGGYGGYGSGGSGGGSNWSFFSWYMSLLAKHPVMTKAFTSGLLTLVGDVVCQLVIDKVPSPDIQRTSIFTLLSLVLVGPTLHLWYLGLSKLITIPGASGGIMRLVLDQFLFAPIFIGIFLSSLMTLEGKASHVIPKLQQEWFSVVLANWQRWVPFQFLNFRFVQQQFQVLAANVISLVWNVILSYKAHKEVLPK